MVPRPLREHFAEAIHRLLRPVVRQLIAYGISYSAFSQIVKEVYVDVAEDEFALPFKRQTDSRLALVTGLNRKEVKQLRRRRRRAVVEVEDTVVTHVIGRWMGGPPYSDARGTPRQLRYDGPRARTPSFTGLVRAVGADVPVRSVLDELLRVRAVELLPNGDVRLHRQVHVPIAAVQGKFTLLSTDPGELFSTIMHNIERPDAPRLQRKVVYDNIGSLALSELRAAAAQVGEEFIRRANTLLASYDRDRNPAAAGGTRTRVVLGVYYFDDAASGEPEPPAADAPPPGRITRSR